MDVTVIGHGPSPLNKGWGPFIDSTIVFRAHNWQWQPARDYGTRCDYSFLPVTRFDELKNPEIHTPSKAWVLYHLPSFPDHLVPEVPTEWKRAKVYVRRYLPEQLCHQLSPFRPTRGLVGIVLAHEFTGAREMNLVGFDRLKNGTFSAHYPGCWHQDRPDTPNEVGSHHSIEREAAFLREWALLKKVELHFY